jgi:hypothetical protein
MNSDNQSVMMNQSWYGGGLGGGGGSNNSIAPTVTTNIVLQYDTQMKLFYCVHHWTHPYNNVKKKLWNNRVPIITIVVIIIPPYL